MVAIQAENLTKTYGADVVFSGVRFHTQRGEKIGLIGANGSGKSTLLKILAGLEQPDAGTFRLGAGLRVGYLRQEKTDDIGGVIGSAAADGSAGAIGNAATKDDGGALGGAGGAGGGDGGAASDGGASDVGVAGRRQGLSGGELARLDFDRLLADSPDILLLDEPTNHLDLDMLDWLEGFVRRFPGTVIAVSHDRYFLDRTADRIFELDRGGLRTYRGNYSGYAEKRGREEIAAQKAAEKEAAERARQEAMIRHMKERGTQLLARRAASREKRLRLADKKGGGVDEALLKASSAKGRAMKISFGDARRSGESVLLADGLGMKLQARVGDVLQTGGHGRGAAGAGMPEGSAQRASAADVGDAGASRTLFENVSFDIRRGEKICMIGKNGIGKTTLLNIITGAAAQTDGFLRLGVGVKVGYYDQHMQSLDSEATALEEMQNALPLMSDTDRRGLLGRFLFRGDMVFRKIGSLSGGEKARLSLLKLIVGGANFLLLDEPTNHLDIASMEAVESALEDFGGTILAVSHDRYFLERIPSRIFELTENGLSVYAGGYDYYRDKKKRGKYAHAEGETSAPESGGADGAVRRAGTGSGSTTTAGPGKTAGASERLTRAEVERRRKKMDETAKRRRARLLAEAEAAIAEKEAEIARLQESLADPEVATDAAKLKEIHENIVWNEREAERLLADWEELMQEG
jgi:ATP-binding cassette subfamily F protein 3